jgi:hypothetical protein
MNGYSLKYSILGPNVKKIIEVMPTIIGTIIMFFYSILNLNQKL